MQELLFERGTDVGHDTARAWWRFGPDLAEGVPQRKRPRGCPWHLDEMRIAVTKEVRWLWRAVNGHREVLDVLLQKRRDAKAAKRLFRRLLDDHELARTATDGLRSYGAALRELAE